jgi:hypothetical protein
MVLRTIVDPCGLMKNLDYSLRFFIKVRSSIF